MKLRNKTTGKTFNFVIKASQDPTASYFILKTGSGGWEDGLTYGTLEELHDEWEDYKPAKPLIKDEKIRKAVRAWAEVLEIDEAEFYGDKTWIGLRITNSRTGWSSKFELDYFGSDNTLVPFKRYTIDELCGENEE